MRKHVSLMAATALLLYGAVPTSALDVNVGGVSVSTGGSGASVSVNSGGTSAGASVGGGGASVGASTSGTEASLAVTTNDGELVGIDQSDGSTDGTVNLGLGGLLGAVQGAAGEVAGLTEVAVAYGSLSSREQWLVRNRCREVLKDPMSFDRTTFMLCKLIREMR